MELCHIAFEWCTYLNSPTFKKNPPHPTPGKKKKKKNYATLSVIFYAAIPFTTIHYYMLILPQPVLELCLSIGRESALRLRAIVI